MDVGDEILRELTRLAEAMQLAEAQALLRIDIAEAIGDLRTNERERLVARQPHAARMLEVGGEEVADPVSALGLPVGRSACPMIRLNSVSNDPGSSVGSRRTTSRIRRRLSGSWLIRPQVMIAARSRAARSKATRSARATPR